MLIATASPAFAHRTLAQKKQLARQQFETAEKMREALNGKPEGERTRADYNRVRNAFRKVYVITPNFRKADESIVDTAELLAETGRAFQDDKASQEAIHQYEFLMREYPGSRHITAAMFTIGKIYQDDLGDNEKAKTAFQEFLSKHPLHPLSDDARQAIEEIDHPQVVHKEVAHKEVAHKKKEEQRGKLAKSKSGSEEERNSTEKTVSLEPAGKLPLVTGIRYWSTPDYTRVAIDIGGEVQYEAARITRPDRIFFDLHNTKLAPELIGKSFSLDDGFLRKIRVAQFQRGLARVVLEVDPVSEYSAFLLPNPYRLIIDIHGKQPASALRAQEPGSREPGSRESKETKAEDAKLESVISKSSVASANDSNFAAPSKKISDLDEENMAVAQKSSSSNLVEENSDTPVETLLATSPAKNSHTSDETLQATSLPTTAPTFESVAPRPERAGKAAKKDRHKNSKEKELAAVAREAQPASDGQRSLIRALGLKIGKIVVDAGHGGYDTGTIGPHGLEEKDLVLDVSLRLGKLLENKMGADVVYTRDDDTFVPLETRTAIANQNQADLFISVHANSSRDPEARGVETYYLNFTSSTDALEVAARENAVSEASIYELQDLVKKIALKDKIEESRELAGDVQSAMHSGLSTRASKMRDRGVKKAPFIVLIGANMPSILAEISFVSNSNDERKLRTPEYRQKIAESLYHGIAKYVAGLSGLKLAAARQQGP